MLTDKQTQLKYNRLVGNNSEIAIGARTVWNTLDKSYTDFG